MKIQNMKFITDGNILDSFVGLMFRKDFEDAMVFKVPGMNRIAASVHTFFMRFNIDVYFLDEDKRVVEVRRNINPWRIVIPKSGCKFVVETKSGKGDWNVGEELEGVRR